MASVNKVILIGNLGRDPEVRYSANGDAVCNLSLATAQQWKDKNTGERREETEWHRVVLYRRLAEVAGEYLRKGASVYIEGRLRTHKWQDKDGQDRYTTEIYAAELKMLGGRTSGSDTSATHPTDNSYQSAKDGKAAPTQTNNSLADMEDDVPF